MEFLIVAVQMLALLVIVIGFSGFISGHIYTWRYLERCARHKPGSDDFPPVSIIKPNRGLDAWTADNFRRFCELDYPNRYEVIFAVEDPTDPSVPVIQQLQRDRRDRDIRLVYSKTLKTRAIGKLRNLIAGILPSRYDVIVLSDSDVQVDPDFLQKAVQPMADPKIGLAFAVPVYRGAQNWAAAMLGLGVNGAVLHSGSTAYRDRIRAAVGSTMVLRRDVLDAIGGLEPLSDRVVGIDISISQAVYRQGYRIHLLDEPARIIHPHSNFLDWWWQNHRWMVTIRSYYPRITPILFLFGVPMWWAIVFWILFVFMGGDVLVGALPLILVVAGHVLSAVIINRRLVHDRAIWRYLWVIPVMDLLTFPLLLHTALSNKVLWGGRWVRVNPDLTADLVAKR